MVTTNRWKLAVIGAAAAAMSLTACSEVATTAATVGDSTITIDEVDSLVDAQCAIADQAAQDPQLAAQAQSLPVRQARAEILNALINADVSQQLADQADVSYDPQQYQASIEQLKASIPPGALSAGQRERFIEQVGGIYQAGLSLQALVLRRLAEAGIEQPSQEQTQEAVGALLSDFLAKTEVTVNPVFGPGPQGVAGQVDSSISKAVSEFARQATSAAPSADFVSSLPNKLRCG